MDPEPSTAPRPTPVHEFRRNWRAFVASTVGVAFGSAGAFYYSTTLFYLPLTKAFGVDLSQVTSLSLIALAPAFVATIFYGRIIDRIGARTPLMLGVIAYALSLGLLAIYDGPFWGFRLLWVLMMICSITVGPVAYARIINGAFDHGRGRALGLTLAGIGVIGFVAPVPIAALIGAHSYRAGYLALAIAALVPLIFLAVLRPASSAASATTTTGMELSGWRPARALRTRAYIFSVLTFMLAGFGIAAMQLQLSPILQSHGITAVAAAGYVSLVGIGVIVGRVSAGFLMDRFHVAHIAPVMFVIAAAAISLLLVPGAGVGFIPAFFIGTAFGMEVDMIAYLVSRFFGLRGFGTLYAIAYISVGVCLSVGPLTASTIFERVGSFGPAIVVAMAALVLAAACSFLIPRSKRMLPIPGAVARDEGRVVVDPAAIAE